MHLYLQLTRSLAVTLIWLYCNKLVLRYVRLRVSDPGQVSIPQPGIVTCINVTPYNQLTIVMFEVRNRKTLLSKNNVCKGDVKIGDCAHSLNQN